VTWKEENDGEEKLTNKACDKTTHTVNTNLKGNIQNNKKDIFTISVKDKGGKEVATATYRIKKGDDDKLTIAKENNP
ncbi:MAG TPA: hypothetical protein O0X38_01205, partial [Methanocorpusculum sp.]|nr:hypothetical protein [Methanocorpusculum sp.]